MEDSFTTLTGYYVRSVYCSRCSRILESEERPTYV